MRAPTLDLTLLRTLVAIADTGSVTAAAKRLAYTQSTVSMQLQRLETQLALTLHEREGRKLTLRFKAGVMRSESEAHASSAIFPGRSTAPARLEEQWFSTTK